MTTRVEKAEATKAQICVSAKIVFVDKGYSGTKVEDIATHAQVSKGSIFHHYNDKQQLALQVARELSSDNLDSLDHISKEQPSFDELLLFLKQQVKAPSNTRWSATQLLLELLLDERERSGREYFTLVAKELVDPFYHKLGDVFNTLGFSSPNITARLFLSLLDGIALHLTLENRIGDDKLIDDLFSVIKELFTPV